MGKPICSVNGCERPAQARTWCKTHYNRWSRTGDPEKLIRRGPLEVRFWRKVDRRGPDECWLWTGAGERYGTIGLGRRHLKAHRVAYELLVGPIPEGLTLDHLCRVVRCVNPAHLEPVTHQENVLRGVGPTAENAKRTHCVHGHLFDEANTKIVVWHGQRMRQCRICHSISERIHGPRRRAERRAR